MGNPTAGWCRLLQAAGARRCIICGTPLRRRWWERGLLAPIDLCPRGHRGLCVDWRWG